MLALFLFLATALRADAMDVTPVEKVIMMIKDLQTKVTREANEKMNWTFVLGKTNFHY